MNNITIELEKLGLPKRELPKALINKINHYDDIVDTLGKTRTEHENEEDEEVKKEMAEKIEEAEEYLSSLEEDIIAIIQDLQAKLDEENSKKNDEPTPPIDEPKPPTPPTPPTPPIDEPKKKSGALKWVVGGAILLLTLGAVNTMNRE
jgi:hypothetical protein